VKRFRGGLVFKAHRLCVSLNSRLESKEDEEDLKSRRSFAPRPMQDSISVRLFCAEREFFIDNLMVRIHFIIVRLFCALC